MKWFTRAYVTGELSDREAERAVRDYAAHLERVRHRLRNGGESLAEVDFHDSTIRRLWFDPDERIVRLTVEIGDLQRGYERLDVTYYDASLTVPQHDAADLNQLENAEVVWDELDVVGPEMEQRLLLWPTGELAIRFDAVHVIRAPS